MTDAQPQAHPLFIGGEWLHRAETFERRDPSQPDAVTGIYSVAGPTDVDQAFAAAAAAQPAWAASSAQVRSRTLRTAAELIDASLDELARTLTADMGKAIRDARLEVARGAEILRYFAGEILQADGETYPSVDPSTLLMTMSEPVGVVGVITPWNFPVAIPLWKLAPALGFGNAVVWKPASAAAGSAIALTAILERAGFPAGVLNVLTGGGGALSERITSAPQLQALTFTGSAATGLELQAALADRTATLQLELGGKNPAIVLEGADLPDAALQVARGAMLATGQRCTATSRCFVQRSIAAEFEQLLTDAVLGMRVGDPYDEGTDIGPLASHEQIETVTSYLDMARGGDARVICGGEPLPDESGGFYVSPTILTEVDPESPLLRDEIFGPVICLVEVDGFEDGLDAANDTEFGLSTAVFTRDLGTALEFARRAQAGLVHINRETAGVEPHVPFGGLKGSSNKRREQGTAARAFFTNTKTIYVRPR